MDFRFYIILFPRRRSKVQGSTIGTQQHLTFDVKFYVLNVPRIQKNGHSIFYYILLSSSSSFIITTKNQDAAFPKKESNVEIHYRPTNNLFRIIIVIIIIIIMVTKFIFFLTSLERISQADPLLM